MMILHKIDLFHKKYVGNGRVANQSSTSHCEYQMVESSWVEQAQKWSSCEYICEYILKNFNFSMSNTMRFLKQLSASQVEYSSKMVECEQDMRILMRVLNHSLKQSKHCLYLIELELQCQSEYGLLFSTPNKTELMQLSIKYVITYERMPYIKVGDNVGKISFL